MLVSMKDGYIDTSSGNWILPISLCTDSVENIACVKTIIIIVFFYSKVKLQQRMCPDNMETIIKIGVHEVTFFLQGFQ